MARLCRFIFPFALVAGVLLLGTAPSAQASFQMRISDGTTTVTITDGVAPVGTGFGDIDGATNGNISAGRLAAPTNVVTIGVFTITAAAGTSKPNFPNSSSLGAIDLSALSVTASGSGTLTIDLSDTGFSISPSGPTANLQSRGNVNTVSSGTVTFQSWLDTTNTQFGMPGTGTGGSQALTPGVANTLNTTVPFANPFSLTNRLTFTTTSGGFLSFDGLTQVTSSAVPAPAGIVLALTGLPFVGLFQWYRRRKAAK